MNKELSSELNIFFGEFRSDINTIKKQLDKHDEKLDAQQEILQQMAKTEVILTNIIDKQTGIQEAIEKSKEKANQKSVANQKKISELEDKVNKHEGVLKIIKWVFTILTAIFIGTTTGFFKSIFGI